jgi:NADPH-dependent 2,4-dienoyl-CoA reductase/sulfur reductase-like enzyme
VLQNVIVIGASLAGLRAAETFRTDGYDGGLTVVGAEAHLPYDRPPLSKQVLAGAWEPDRIALRKPDAYADLALDLRLGTLAVALDASARTVTLDTGEVLTYDGIVIATGASPRHLPAQPDLAGIHVLRSLDEALSLRADLDASPGHVVVIGAGFIGMEVAATARQRGLAVTVLEGLPAPLVRGLGARLGHAVASVHTRNGVDLRLRTGVAGFAGGDRVEAVLLDDGTRVPADVVVVGIGVAPATHWLTDSGLEVRDGVVCDATLAAGPPGVYAAGDVARFPHELVGAEVRIEHWTAAAEMGAAAAKNLLATASGGVGTAYATVPFVWSDQFDARIQLLGRAGEHDDVEIVHGSETDSRFVALYGRAGRLTAVLGVSMPRRVMPFRNLLASRASWDEALAFAAQQV